MTFGKIVVQNDFLHLPGQQIIYQSGPPDWYWCRYWLYRPVGIAGTHHTLTWPLSLQFSVHWDKVWSGGWSLLDEITRANMRTQVIIRDCVCCIHSKFTLLTEQNWWLNRDISRLLNVRLICNGVMFELYQNKYLSTCPVWPSTSTSTDAICLYCTNWLYMAGMAFDLNINRCFLSSNCIFVILELHFPFFIYSCLWHFTTVIIHLDHPNLGTTWMAWSLVVAQQFLPSCYCMVIMKHEIMPHWGTTADQAWVWE